MDFFPAMVSFDWSLSGGCKAPFLLLLLFSFLFSVMLFWNNVYCKKCCTNKFETENGLGLGSIKLQIDKKEP